MTEVSRARNVVPGLAEGPVLFSPEALSFWGGVDPATSRVIDAHHPLRGATLAGAILLMPTSRGSCSGSGVLLDMALNGRAPAALVFCGPEDVLTLGALIAAEMYGVAIPVFRLPPRAFEALAGATRARIDAAGLEADGVATRFAPAPESVLELAAADREMLAGGRGPAVRVAMRIVRAMAAQQGAERLVDVGRVHIDGCIYASPANLRFAQDMAKLGAKATIPTTTNAISVDRENWRAQGVAPEFGGPAAELADAYVRMGCAASFTCAPYLLEDPPREGEYVAWSESNAVLFANSVLGARTAKHPDFLDLCIALTGRAPLAGAYLDEERKARRVIDVEAPPGANDAFWPLVGYLAGRLAPDRVPLLRGLARLAPSRDDLKALCAAFGATSAAAMLHIEGVTPEAAGAIAADADRFDIARADLLDLWQQFNRGPAEVDLVAFGSPHASLDECRAIADRFGGRRRSAAVAVIVTAGRGVIAQARRDGLAGRLEESGAQLLPDLCWCSISEPVFPPGARAVITNSGKYAHYGEGLSGRAVRFGSLADCVEAAIEGKAPTSAPRWLV